jgi:hypothetical protein
MDYDKHVDDVTAIYDELIEENDLDVTREPMGWKYGEPSPQFSWQDSGREYNILASVLDFNGTPMLYVEANASEDDYDELERKWTNEPVGLFSLEDDAHEDGIREAYTAIRGAELDRTAELDLTEDEVEMLRD